MLNLYEFSSINVAFSSENIGDSWKRVFETSKMPRAKKEVAYTFVAYACRPKNKSGSKSDKAKQKKENGGSSLLSILREVEEFEELIPPNPPPAISRPITMPRLSTDVALRAIRSSTDTTNYHNAFSDLVFCFFFGTNPDKCLGSDS